MSGLGLSRATAALYEPPCLLTRGIVIKRLV